MPTMTNEHDLKAAAQFITDHEQELVGKELYEGMAMYAGFKVAEERKRIAKEIRLRIELNSPDDGDRLDSIENFLGEDLEADHD